MPTSEHVPGDTLLPETPDGYAEPVEFRYPMVVLVAIAAVLTVAALVAFGSLLRIGQGDALPALFGYEATADGFTFSIPIALGLVFVATVAVVTVLHELLHGLVFRWQGYDVSYGFVPQMGAFYAAAFHQFQLCEETRLVALAPLFVLDVLLVPLLFVPIPMLAVAAFFGLVLNTAGSAGDLYIVWRLGRYPPGTLSYDADIRHMYVFVPEE